MCVFFGGFFLLRRKSEREKCMHKISDATSITANSFFSIAALQQLRLTKTLQVDVKDGNSDSCQRLFFKKRMCGDAKSNTFADLLFFLPPDSSVYTRYQRNPLVFSHKPTRVAFTLRTPFFSFKLDITLVYVTMMTMK